VKDFCWMMCLAERTSACGRSDKFCPRAAFSRTSVCYDFFCTKTTCKQGLCRILDLTTFSAFTTNTYLQRCISQVDCRLNGRLQVSHTSEESMQDHLGMLRSPVLTHKTSTDEPSYRPASAAIAYPECRDQNCIQQLLDLR
jgi:hypothetical protein